MPNVLKKRASIFWKDADAILVPGGFGERGVEGKLMAVQYARENKVPYFWEFVWVCDLSSQFARNVLGLKEANSTEFNRQTPHPVIGLITQWTTSEGAIEKRDESSDLGGTMRWVHRNVVWWLMPTRAKFTVLM